MSDYDLIEYGYNTADETVNFGSRCLSAGDSLFEVVTLATMKCSQQSQDALRPTIRSKIAKGRLFCSINNTFRVFQERDHINILFNISCDAIIDTFSVSRDGDYVLVGVRGGTVNLFDCKNDFACVFSRSLSSGNNAGGLFIESFLEVDDGRSTKFLIVSQQGVVHRIRFTNGSSKINVDIEEICNLSTEITGACLNNPWVFLRGLSRNFVLDLSINNEIISETNHINLKKIFAFDYSIFLALEDDGVLVEICGSSLLTFPVNDCPNLYEDISFFTENDNRYLIAITKENEENKDRFLQILSYPHFEIICSLKIGDQVHLISPESINDELLYISELKTDEIIKELRLHMICETEPEQRLLRLVKKQKYSEAEKFANTFNLSLDIIKKAKAQIIVEQVQCESEDVDKLINLLDDISDEIEFKLDCCLNVDPNDFKDVRRVLTYGCSLGIDMKLGDNSSIVDLQNRLSRLMYTSDIFLSIGRISGFKINDWNEFSRCDLIERTKYHLKNYEIDEAIIVYSRLDLDSITLRINEKVLEIINVLNKVPYETFHPFLAVFVHKTLSNSTTAFPLFVEWTIEKVMNLELKNTMNFPENCLEIVINMSECLRHSEISDSSWNKLHELFGFLKQLKQLKDEYNIRVPLKDFLIGPKAVVRKLLNVQMSLEAYETLLGEFLSDFMIKNNLNLNEIYLTEVTNIIKNYEESYWIEIVRSILNCMTSVETKLSAILVILDGAKVPWTDNVRQIASNALKYSHPNVELVRGRIQDEPVTVILKKPIYKIKEKSIRDLKDLKFFVNRIIYCNDESMIEDVYRITKNKASYRYEACKLLVRDFIKKGEIQRALEILDNNDEKVTTKLSKEFLNEAEVFINNSKYAENYYNILGALTHRLIDQKTTPFALNCLTERVDAIKSVYKVSKNYGAKLTSGDLGTNKRRMEIAENLIDSIIEGYLKQVLDIHGVIGECQKLSHALSLDKEEILLNVCCKVQDFDLILETAKVFNYSSTCCKNLCLISVLTLKNLGIRNTRTVEVENSMDDTFILPDVEVPDNNLSTCGLKLAQENVSKALLNTSGDELSACLGIVNWMTIVNMNKNDSDGKMGQITRKMHEDGIFGFSTVTVLRNTFNLFCNFIGRYYNPDLRYLSHFCEKSSWKSPEDFLREIKILPLTIDDLIKEGQHFFAFNLSKTLSMSMYCLNNPIPEIRQILSKTMTNNCIPRIIQTTFDSQQIDADLVYNFLLLSPSKEFVEKIVLSNLRMYRRDSKKFSIIAQVGIKLWDHFGITQYRDKFVTATLTVKWWEKVKHPDFRYDNFFRITPAQRFELLSEADLPNFDLKTIEEYCEDFGLPLQRYYVVYLKSMLKSWKPRFEVVEGKLLVTNDELEILGKCRKVADVIQEKADILNLVNSIWNSVNFYYYEIFIAILALTSDLNIKTDREGKERMLYFLKSYQRVRKPSQMEVEQWFTSFPDTQSVDPLSEFRLPFTGSLFTSDIWNIIRQEINLQTYKFWFHSLDAVRQSFLNVDEICCFVVKDVVASGVLSNKGGEKWVFHQKHECLLNEVDECISNVVDLEKATSAIYHLMINCPSGADQVHAAKLCYKYGVLYRKMHSDDENVEKAFTKIKRKYSSFSVLHILHSYQLDDETYLSLVSRPEELIKSLYHDKRIFKKVQSIHTHCPDISQATEEISKLFKLDIHKIRIDLLKNWLSDGSNFSCDFDTSSVMGNPSTQDFDRNEDNLKRAAYVCSSDGDNAFWLQYLLKLGLQSADKESVTIQGRALKVLASITDVETLESITEVTYDELMYFVDKLTLIGNLQYLGISVEIDALDQSSKKEIFKSLALRTGNSLSVKTMGMLCMTYTMENVKYWEFIINNAIKHSMFSELKTYVKFLNKETFKYKTFYVNAWQCLVDHKFVVLNSLSDDQKHAALIDNFLMIQSCPVVYSLNFRKAFMKCVHVKKYEFAVLLIQYINDERLIKTLLSEIGDDFMPALDKLALAGLSGVSVVKSILQNNYNSI